ncbi:toprim domain-containing protein [Candidatus Woesearchaeota archaeon]|nr:toprim domain-containing protein [Candidatus Woesearchaeota archaeon]
MNSEILEELQRLLDDVCTSSLLVVVEGKKDKACLIKLGVPGKNIITLTKPLFEVVEDIAARIEKENLPSKVVLLTDLDTEGKKLYATLARGLEDRGMDIDNQLRFFLRRKTPVRHIEGLFSYFEKITVN